LANEAAIIPFPSEELTPPVTKMYLIFDIEYWFVQNYKVCLLLQVYSVIFDKKKTAPVYVQSFFNIESLFNGLCLQPEYIHLLKRQTGSET
jgi:hypothetical protein